MVDADLKIHWSAAIAVKGIGPSTLQKIQTYLNKTQSSWSDFWVNRNELWGKIGLSKNIAKSIYKFTKDYNPYSYYQALIQQGISVVTADSDQYPRWLKKIEDKPLVLFVKGSLNIDSKLPIAVVGTRNMTLYGRQVTEKITSELVGLGACIVSGFMYGVDAAAQKQALSVGGATIGVLGSGFDHVYPSSHRDLMIEFLKSDKTAFISEYPPWVKPSKGTFPMRNRIIAGLSLGVLVTEAALKSGTQITVGRALEYGRDVFAVPGPITSPFSHGVKHMINQGARLISSGEELLRSLSALNWDIGLECVKDKVQLAPDNFAKNNIELNGLEKKLLGLLAKRPLNADQIAQATGVKIADIQAELISLQLKGLVLDQAGRWFVRR